MTPAPAGAVDGARGGRGAGDRSLGIFSGIGGYLRRQVAKANRPAERLAERQFVLQALALARANRDRPRLAGLHEAEFCAFSQWGEDGIIDWLAARLPDAPPSFVEFGVEDYTEANTRLLLQLRNWRGLVIDGSADNIAAVRRQDVHWRHDLTAVDAFITRDNINALIGDAGFSGDIGLLSIDIDGNDYWVWQAIDVVSPAIVVCEYNAVLGDRHALTVPYKADFRRAEAHHSRLYFGASLPALIALGRDKGYAFVGTTSTGCNAFFVRADLAAAVTEALDSIHAFPSAVREARGPDGRLTFLGGARRREVIADLPLVDVETGGETTLAALGEIYSPEWLAGRGKRQ